MVIIRIKGIAMKKLLSLLSLLCLSAWAADPEFTLVIRDHRFEPAEIRVPAGQKIKLVVHNQDATPEEFESFRVFALANGIRVCISAPMVRSSYNADVQSAPLFPAFRK